MKKHPLTYHLFHDNILSASLDRYSVVMLLRSSETPLAARISAILSLDERLQQWWRRVDSGLKLSPDGLASVPRGEMIRVLHINTLYHQSLSALHASIVPLFSCSPGDGWLTMRRVSAQVAFEHADKMSALITALLEMTPSTSIVPMFMGYAAYCGCAIQIPFMWSSNPTVKARAVSNVNANSKLLQLMTVDWTFASVLVWLLRIS